MIRYAVALLAGTLAAQAHAESPPQGATTAVTAPSLPANDDRAARDSWIAECGRRIDAAGQTQSGPEPFRQTCAAWLDYFQRTPPAARAADGGLAIPVSMVRVTTMVPCTPRVIERKIYVTRPRHHHGKRVWIAD
ncbi:MAG: hypothetical protein JSS36_09860 [Proteobacteria bacterium]|nr:hypothetical protein [Pseudomonadota bacterium]